MNPSQRFAKRVSIKESSLRTRMLDIAAGLTDVIALGRGDPDLDTPAHVIEAGQKALGNGATHYTHPLGMPQLREAIATSIRANGGGDYSADEIVVTAGAQESMFVAMLALIDPGEEVIIPSPGYNSYHQAVELAGGLCVSVPTFERDGFALTAEAVEARLTPASRMLCLINPSNPTGMVIPPSEIEKLAALAIKHDLIVISDEIYARLVYDNARVVPVASLPGMKERTITIDGFSKAYAMTGWRVGYFAAPRHYAKAMAEIHHGLAICAPAVSQHAALAALSGSQDCVEAARQQYDARRRTMMAALDRMGLSYARPNGAFYVYANVSSTGASASDFCLRLLQDGKVMMFPGSLFGDHCDDYVRISLLQPVPKIEEAARRMDAVVKAMKSENKSVQPA
ncbi:MAG: pyridoxal phosphate-dependent aminotransferase [Hyphomicrobiales bacterium]|nr:pyridoxal phosphate-dependent aminotransferase [Hyphomicrobiales bacterium]